MTYIYNMIQKAFKLNLGDDSIGELQFEKHFDEEGRLISERGRGTLDNWDYTYDEFGRLCIQNSTEGMGWKEFEYDGESNRVLYERWYDKSWGPAFSDGRPLIWKYTYNEFDLLAEKISDHLEIDWFDRWTYEYDSAQNIISEKYYFRTGMVHGETRFTYDEFGNEILKEPFSKGSSGTRYSKTYGGDGQLMRMVESFRNRFTGDWEEYIITTYEYQDGRLIKSTRYDNHAGRYESATVFQYTDGRF